MVETMTAEQFYTALWHGRSVYTNVRFTERIVFDNRKKLAPINWGGSHLLNFARATFEREFNFYDFPSDLPIQHFSFNNCCFKEKAAFGRLSGHTFAAGDAEFNDWAWFCHSTFENFFLHGSKFDKGFGVKNFEATNDFLLHEVLSPLSLLDIEPEPNQMKNAKLGQRTPTPLGEKDDKAA